MPASRSRKPAGRASTAANRLNQAANASFGDTPEQRAEFNRRLAESYVAEIQRDEREGRYDMSEDTKAADKPAVRLPARRVGDVTESSLWPDLPQAEIEDLIGTDIIIEDVRFLSSSKYPKADGSAGEYAILKCQNPETGGLFTMANGGAVVLQKLHECKDKRAFPVLGAFREVTPAAGGRAYYDLL